MSIVDLVDGRWVREVGSGEAWRGNEMKLVRPSNRTAEGTSQRKKRRRWKRVGVREEVEPRTRILSTSTPKARTRLLKGIEEISQG